MSRVVLLSATPSNDQTAYNLAPTTELRESAALDRFGVHQVSDDPESADLILFAEFYGGGFHFERVRRHPLVRRFREKCFLFCSNAIVIPFLPGVYASVEQRWASSRTTGGFHMGVVRNEFTTFTPPTEQLPYLFSFTGCAANAPVRQRVLRLRHERAFLRDSEADFQRVLHFQMSQEERREYHRRYAEASRMSKFVLCPRGVGASTIRLYETMRTGRVPVIISDRWREPEGPRWETFSIRVAEAEVERIPQLLEARESEAVAMGERAHAAWQEWFSDEVAFHRVVESCLALRAQRRLPEAIARWPVYLQYLRPFHGKRLLRRLYEQARGRSASSVPAASLARGEV